MITKFWSTEHLLTVYGKAYYVVLALLALLDYKDSMKNNIMINYLKGGWWI